MPCSVARAARNRDDGPPSGSPMSAWSVTNPVENVSVSTTSSAPAAAAAATCGARWAKLASRSAHTMSCCTAATRVTARHFSAERGEPVDRLVDHVERLAAGEPDEMVTELAAGVHHLTGYGHHTTSFEAAATERHPVASGIDGTDVGDDEVRRLRFGRRRTRRRRARRTADRAWPVRSAASSAIEVVAERQSGGDRRLERCPVHVGEELLRCLGRRRRAPPGRTSSRPSIPSC